MSARSAAKPHVPVGREDLARATVSKTRPTAHADAAANDEELSRFSVIGDPLLGMAIGTIILFAVLAALVALA
jgi:hypothetical protein